MSAFTLIYLLGKLSRGVADGGVARVTTPALLETAGVDPAELWIFQHLFS